MFYFILFFKPILLKNHNPVLGIGLFTKKSDDVFVELSPLLIFRPFKMATPLVLWGVWYHLHCSPATNFRRHPALWIDENFLKGASVVTLAEWTWSILPLRRRWLVLVWKGNEVLTCLWKEGNDPILHWNRLDSGDHGLKTPLDLRWWGSEIRTYWAW